MYLTTPIPTLNHTYNTRREAVKQTRTYHVFADSNCVHAIIDLINKSPIIKAHITSSNSLPHFVSIVKTEIVKHYNLECNIDGCYVYDNYGSQDVKYYGTVNPHFLI